MNIDVTKYQTGSEQPDYRLRDSSREWFLRCKNADELVQIQYPPVGWLNLSRTLKRDDQWHGFYIQYGGGQNEVSFVEDTLAYEKVTGWYAAYGVDAEVEILEYATANVTVPLFVGRIDYSTYKKVGTLFTVTLSNASAYDKLKKNWDINVSTGSLADFGADLPTTSLEPYRVSMFGTPVQGRFRKVGTGLTGDGVEEFNGNVSRVFFTYETEKPEINEADEVFEQPMGFSTENPMDNQRSVAKFTFGGFVSVKLKVLNANIRIEVVKRRLTNQPLITSAIATTKLVRDGWGELTINTQVVPPTTFKSFIDIPISFEYEGINLGVNRDGNMYIYTDIQVDIINNGTALLSYQSGLKAYALIPNYELLIDQVSIAPQSVTKFYKPKELMQRALLANTLGEISLQSNYFDTCGEYDMITDGKLLRGLDPATNPMKYSMRSLMATFQAINGVGWGLEYDGDLNESVMRVEPAEYFYQDELIFSFEDKIAEYEESFDSSRVFSKVQVGWKRYKEEGNGSANEFHTVHEYKTPVVYSEGLFERSADFIGSAILIEEQRRLSFATDSDDEGKGDDLFIVACVLSPTETIVADVTFMEAYSTVMLSDNTEEELEPEPSFTIDTLPDTFVAGAVITVSGTINNNKTFTIRDTFFSSYRNKWVVLLEYEPLAVAELITTVTIEVINPTIRPEKDEAIIGSNIPVPALTYNMRYNPKYMLYNQYIEINAALAHRSVADRIAAVKIPNNTKATFQRRESAGCVFGDVNKTLSVMDAGVSLEAIGDFKAKYIPVRVSFKTVLTHEQFRYIWNKFGGGGLPAEYGYLRVKAPCNEWVEFYPTEIKWTESENIAEVFGLKKKVN